MRLHSILTSSAVLAALCSMLIGGCGGGTQEEDGLNPALRDGALNGALSEDAPGKITLCHVPPGNPANAHTLTVGASAWNGHRHHKGDYLGPCGGGAPDAGTPPTEPDGGTEPEPTPDAGTPEPVCAPAGAACGTEVVCCSGLECQEGSCQPIIQ